MFVIVHQHHAIDGRGDGGIVVLRIPRLNADVKLHAFGVQIVRQLVQQGEVTGLTLLGEGFEVDHQAAIFVGRQKCSDLLPEAGAGRRDRSGSR